MTEWAPKDVRAHIAFQHGLNAELLDSGELVDAQGLTGPDAAKFVVSDGVNPPKIVDGPYPESKELLAGYRLVDVDSLNRLSRSPRGRRPHPARTVCRSSSGSRCAR